MRSLVWLFCAAVLGAASASSALTLASWQMGSTWGTRQVGLELRAGVAFGFDLDSDSPVVRGVLLAEENLGVDFVARRTESPELAATLDQLTAVLSEDGMRHWSIDDFQAPGGPQSSAITFGGEQPTLDLRGFVVDAVHFELSTFSIDIPGEDPNGDGLWTSVHWRALLTLEGRAIPEPSSALLMGLACAGCLIRLTLAPRAPAAAPRGARARGRSA